MKHPIKVAHVVLGLRVGGLERIVLGLLERTRRDRFSPSLCVLEQPGELAGELACLDVPLFALRRSPGLDLAAIHRLSAWLRREEIGVVHTHNPSPHVTGALAAALSRAVSLQRASRRRPRVIHTRHGRNIRWTQRNTLANRLASTLTDRIVAVSEDARRVAIDVGRIDPAKVVTIVNGIDLDEYSPRGDPHELRKRLGLPLRGRHIVCVARLAPEKGHATLLSAFAALRRSCPDAHLTLIGDGVLRAELERRAARLGVSCAVTFAGTRHDVAALLPAFDVFALASSLEGLSLTLLEAAAAGLPLVATCVGGNPEIIEDGKTGQLVPPGAPLRLSEALAAVLARPDRVEMGRQGRARVLDRFSADRMVRAYEELYVDVLSGT